MTLGIAGERRLWNPGLLSGSVWVALYGAEGYAVASELSAQVGAAYHAPNYARLERTLTDWSISATTGAASNRGRLAFAAPGPGASWPGVVALALMSAATGGDLLIGAVVPGAALVATGTSALVWEPGQIILDV